MPSFVIHLAIAKKQLELNKIKNEEEYIYGVIAPDLLKGEGKPSHYYDENKNIILKEYCKSNTIETDYDKGYFLHLVTDYLFYNNFLEKWEPSIYNDYDILNERLIKKYQIDIPEQVQEHAKFKDGELKLLDYESIIDFIEETSKISLEEIYNSEK